MEWFYGPKVKKGKTEMICLVELEDMPYVLKGTDLLSDQKFGYLHGIVLFDSQEYKVLIKTEQPKDRLILGWGEDNVTVPTEDYLQKLEDMSRELREWGSARNILEETISEISRNRDEVLRVVR